MLSLFKLALILLAGFVVLVGAALLTLSNRVIDDATHRQVIRQQMKDSHEMHNWRLR